jgi:hypothetical protein
MLLLLLSCRCAVIRGSLRLRSPTQVTAVSGPEPGYVATPIFLVDSAVTCKKSDPRSVYLCLNGCVYVFLSVCVCVCMHGWMDGCVYV